MSYQTKGHHLHHLGGGLLEFPTSGVYYDICCGCWRTGGDDIQTTTKIKLKTKCTIHS